MKILIVTHYFFPHVGGIEKVAKDNAEILNNNGYTATILSSLIGSLKKKEIAKSYHIIRIRASNIFEKYFNIPYPIFSPELITALYREINKSDIIHIHDIYYISSILAAIISLLLNKPYLVTQHVAYVDHPNIIVRLLQKAIYLIFGTLILKKSRLIITYNIRVTKFVAKLGASNGKIKELKHGVDNKLFHPVDKKNKLKIRKKYHLPIDKKIALFVGRFVPKKGANIVLAARDKKYVILFVGNDTKVSINQNIDNAIFMGKLDQKQLSEIYQCSDVFILPTKGEIFTLAMQEAMSTGLPIITTKDKKYTEYNINTKLVKFIEPNAIDIKKSLNSVISNKTLRTNMSTYSLRVADKFFNLNSNNKNFIKLFNLIK